MTRRQAREAILKGLYTLELMEWDIDRVMEDITKTETPNEKMTQFIVNYLETVISNLDFLDAEVTRLAENWELKRIAIIDKNILRMALAEIHYMPDIPQKVAINEAIDLAKQFSTLESSSFVNGILDAAMNEMDQG